MGEQDTFPSSNPVYILVMRNSRGKLFVYLAVLGVLCFIVFLLSNTHTSLKELEGVSEKCQQQRDSLSAQLQVVYEHKNRLEKSLQQEKTDHKRTKEDKEKMISELESKFQKEKDDRQKFENQVSQMKTSYSQLEDEKTQSEDALKQRLKTIQSEKDTEIEKLQTHITELLSDKDKLENSNSALMWKVEQRSSELTLCHLQHDQTRSELQALQEQLKAHGQNREDVQPPVQPPAIVGATHDENNAIDRSPSLLHQDQQGLLRTKQVPPLNTGLLKENDGVQLPHAVADAPFNTTVSPPSHEKPSLLEKPHIMPNNMLGDGVLPKPVDLKPDENKEMDAALEVDSNKNEKLGDEALLNNLVNRDMDANENMIYVKREGVIPPGPPQVINNQLNLDNHPQVVAPNLDEKDDHAGERGEEGNQQYMNQEAKQQVEGPAIGKLNAPQKEMFPVQENNDIAQQMNDMMNKSPGEVNPPVVEQNVLGIPPHIGHPEHKGDAEFKNGNFLHRGADANRVIDDKNYEEDDDDRENDDEPPNGLAPVMKGMNNILQDNDFDDQENPENADNAKEEEGVVVAPK